MNGGPDTFDDMDRPTAEPRPPCSSCGNPAPPAQLEFVDWVSRLVHAHRTSLATIARREGLSPEDAFDAVQEAFFTFITLPQARSLVDAPEPSRNFLAALVRNVARNRRRLHTQAHPHLGDPALLDSLPASAASVEELIAAAEDHVRLAGCLHTLAEVPRTVVTLRMLDEVPGDDVARILGISAGHVAVLLHRAKANLLACMTSSDGSTAP
jgi:RNA polymerase sigma-70 factor, ECF subfamily